MNVSVYLDSVVKTTENNRKLKTFFSLQFPKRPVSVDEECHRDMHYPLSIVAFLK